MLHAEFSEQLIEEAGASKISLSAIWRRVCKLNGMEGWA